MKNQPDNFDKGKAVMQFAMQDINKIANQYYEKHPHATGAAMLAVTRDIYLRAYGPETTAMMFYKLADDLAVQVPKKYI
jgi:hypothetical protein